VSWEQERYRVAKCCFVRLYHKLTKNSILDLKVGSAKVSDLFHLSDMLLYS
jgi:hypothetical protein